MNTDREIQLRRYSDNLRNAGMAYVIFGIWSVIKILASVTMDSRIISEITEPLQGQNLPDEVVWIVYGIIFLVMFAVILYVHLRIGVAAIRYSKGRRKKGFLFLAFLIFIVTILSIESDFTSVENGFAGRIDETTIAAFVVDVTVLFLYIDMFVSIYMIDRYSKDAG